jgi:hypothetical protein
VTLLVLGQDKLFHDYESTIFDSLVANSSDTQNDSRNSSNKHFGLSRQANEKIGRCCDSFSSP